MNRILPIALLTFAGVLVITPMATAVTYTATILHSTGYVHSQAEGVSGSSQIGTAWVTSFFPKAVLWNGPSTVPTNLHPDWLDYSAGSDIAGSIQVGSGSGTATAGQQHALLWHGTAASAVDLHPTNYIYSSASATTASHQVGSVGTEERNYAFLWAGSAASGVNLHLPAEYLDTWAEGIDGNSQVGYGLLPGTTFQYRALLWSGTAASRVNLHPADLHSSYALDVSGTQQVGYGQVTDSGNNRALLWSGTAESLVDLHPVGYESSVAQSISAAGQVGSARVSSDENDSHAMLWNGTAASAVDLHSLITELDPAFEHSFATDISDDGTIVGYAWDVGGQGQRAVIWTPIAEPTLYGDFNDDGTVNAADYVLWRKGASLQNEYSTIGSNTVDDYNDWRQFYGTSLPGSDTSLAQSTAIPEPATCTLLTACVFGTLAPVMNRRRP